MIMVSVGMTCTWRFTYTASYILHKGMCMHPNQAAYDDDASQ